MDSEVEALDYDAMDFDDVNAAFCADLLTAVPNPKRCLDVGTGTGRIPLRLCKEHLAVRVVGVDLAGHMLKQAALNVQQANLADRISFRLVDAKSLVGVESFDVVMSNSLIHHVPNPETALRAMWGCVHAGGTLFVRDLARPDSSEAVELILSKHAGAPPAREEEKPRFERQVFFFRASLHAALTLEEVREVARAVGIVNPAVEMTSDRHWTLRATK